MTRTAIRCLLLVGVGAAGCGILARLAFADDAPAAAVPAVTLLLHEGSTTLFGGEDTDLHVDLKSENPVSGKLVWQHTAENRTLSAGEVAVQANEPVAFKLHSPAVKEGVFLETQLSLSLVDDPPNPQKQRPQATLVRKLWIVDPDAFSERKQWLKELKLALYDPVGDTARVFERAQIPFAKVATLGALDQTAEGIVLIGEGLDLSRLGALGESILLLAERGISVLCLAPAGGDLPYPACAGATPLWLHFDGDRIVSTIDERLSAAAWPAAGPSPPRHFVPSLVHGDLRLHVSSPPPGWPWIEAKYPGQTRLILCGFPIMATWKHEPTARYLLVRILERLERPKETASE